MHTTGEKPGKGTYVCISCGTVVVLDDNTDTLKDVSVISSDINVGGEHRGKIALVGPKRMDYSKVISVLKYINRRMNQGGLLGAGKEEEK